MTKRYIPGLWIEGCLDCPHNQALDELDCEFDKCWASCPLPTQEDVVVVSGMSHDLWENNFDVDGAGVNAALKKFHGQQVEVTIRKIGEPKGRPMTVES